MSRFIFRLVTTLCSFIIIHCYNPIGFVPQLSSNCSSSLSAFLQILPTYTCTDLLSTTLTNSKHFSVCSSGVNGTNCFDIGKTIGKAQSSKLLVPVYRLVNDSSCNLCTRNSGMSETCPALLSSIESAIYGLPLNYTALGIQNNSTEIARINAYEPLVAKSCNGTSDKASIHILRYQSQVLCTATDTFGYTVSKNGNIEGILDMRALPQCGSCAVIPCLNGQLCKGDGNAKMCPAGYYCPTTAEQIECPSGSFCPQGSTSPTACRGIAAYTCPSKSKREVVWVPLTIAVIVFSIIVAIEDTIRKNQMQEQQLMAKSAFTKIETIGDDDEVQLPEVSSPVTITFNHLRLVSGSTVRINDVSGVIKPGKFTAILGGSGAGKTSLMNILLGRENRTAGDIEYTAPHYAGPLPAKLLDRIIAFVPQNDVYLREMTVEELVRFSALTRLPLSIPKKEINDRIEVVLNQLQLVHLRSVVVGGFGGTSSLSPGDRKKVNIALELVSGPNVLFLDEPTTGIDSSSALNVAQIIHNLARTGLTCVAVIHQPRAEIFSLMDEMIILIRGGRMAYQGPTSIVLPYFEHQGYNISNPKANKTDFLIDLTSKAPPPADVIARSDVETLHFNTQPQLQDNHEKSNHTDKSSSIGKYEPIATQEGKDFEPLDMEQKKNSVNEWADRWQEFGEKFVKDRLETNNKKLDLNDPEALALSRRSQTHNFSTKVPLDVARPGFFHQIVQTFQRALQQHLKNSVYISDMFIHLLGGIIMGIVSCNGPLYLGAIPATYQGSCPPGSEAKCNTWIRFEIGPASFLMTMILGAITIPGAVRTFGREKEVFARESAIGANKISYFLGKSLADFPFMAINVFMFMAPLIAIAPWQSPTDKLYAVLYCISIVVTSMGYWISFLLEDADTAVLTGTILAILLCLFSGFVPKIGDGFIGLIMYTHWACRALVAVELGFGQGLTEVSQFNSVVTDNWQNPDWTYDCGSIIIVSLVLWSLSFLSLLYKNRRISSI